MPVHIEPWNGPGKELRGRLTEDDRVYCVNCGTIFVYARHRDCPSCTLAKEIEELKDELGVEETR